MLKLFASSAFLAATALGHAGAYHISDFYVQAIPHRCVGSCSGRYVLFCPRLFSLCVDRVPTQSDNGNVQFSFLNNGTGYIFTVSDPVAETKAHTFFSNEDVVQNPSVPSGYLRGVLNAPTKVDFPTEQYASP
ncbi:hypothetical protein FH972_025645 [Carpinus fangiana]|uniref:Uncharacterized protein n=1 Tax=Carpinus fangiana TaxID=176857 RepID=A0A5N6L475_9ROSI|nr:hypothetical protein FH972_025645 [Carpinus fangiana]